MALLYIKYDLCNLNQIRSNQTKSLYSYEAHVYNAFAWKWIQIILVPYYKRASVITVQCPTLSVTKDESSRTLFFLLSLHWTHVRSVDLSCFLCIVNKRNWLREKKFLPFFFFFLISYSSMRLGKF